MGTSHQDQGRCPRQDVRKDALGIPAPCSPGQAPLCLAYASDQGQGCAYNTPLLINNKQLIYMYYAFMYVCMIHTTYHHDMYIIK